ncbi:MAG: hypothetical protein HY290_26180 [Planctomycetia bacterium]|nr:hypothetical protein [Planctomycetia bacterium]
MRSLSLSIVAVVLVGLLAADSAFAQGQGRRGRGGAGGGFGQMGELQLLGLSQVQKELKLSDDQVAKVKEIADANRQGRPQGGNQNLSQEERDARFAEIRKKSEEAGKQAVALLNEEQATRLKQVKIWAEGSRALTRDEAVAKELNLTDDQKGALKTIGDESGRKIGEIAQSGGRGANEETRKKIAEDMAAVRKSTDAECMAVLTDDQKAKFEKLRGPKFELDMTALAAGRGGRRGRTNN